MKKFLLALMLCLVSIMSFGQERVNRVKLNFGEQYGIYINSRMNEGTTVSIKIPVLGDEVDNV